jgi:beclin
LVCLHDLLTSEPELISAGSIATPTQQQVKNLSPSRPAYPQERKALYDRISRDATSPTYKRSLGGSRQDGGGSTLSSTVRGGFKDKQEMSFYLLSESEVVPPAVTKPENTKVKTQEHNAQPALDGLVDEGKTMSHEMERVLRLFEILSARSDIDHPICVECTELLVDGLQKRLEAATRERDAYVGFLKQVQAEIPSQEEIQETKAALKKAQDEEAAAIKELTKLEAEKVAVDDEIAELEKEARALDREEEQFWMSRNSFAIQLAEFQNERDSVNLKYDHDSQQLEKLQRTNVYNDTFCISHDGSFGTINGLRLGRLSNVPVGWPEINAAWGHTLLLLATVAEKLGFKFEGYELQPMGSTSRILKIDYPSPTTSRVGSSRQKTPSKRSILELYSSGDMPLGLTFMHRKFDNAMVAFLECMRQLGAHVEQETARVGRPLKLPYKIEGEKIDDVSIRLGIAQDDLWSKACKYTLTCCKFLLAHASNASRRVAI